MVKYFKKMCFELPTHFDHVDISMVHCTYIDFRNTCIIYMYFQDTEVQL